MKKIISKRTNLKTNYFSNLYKLEARVFLTKKICLFIYLFFSHLIYIYLKKYKLFYFFAANAVRLIFSTKTNTIFNV